MTTKNCPPEGVFYAWGKCDGNIIVKILVPAEARRKDASGKCFRCDKAEALSFYNFAGEEMPGIYGGTITNHGKCDIFFQKGKKLNIPFSENAENEKEIFFYTDFHDAVKGA